MLKVHFLLKDGSTKAALVAFEKIDIIRALTSDELDYVERLKAADGALPSRFVTVASIARTNVPHPSAQSVLVTTSGRRLYLQQTIDEISASRPDTIILNKPAPPPGTAF